MKKLVMIALVLGSISAMASECTINRTWFLFNSQSSVELVKQELVEKGYTLDEEAATGLRFTAGIITEGPYLYQECTNCGIATSIMQSIKRMIDRSQIGRQTKVMIITNTGDGQLLESYSGNAPKYRTVRERGSVLRARVENSEMYHAKRIARSIPECENL